VAELERRIYFSAIGEASDSSSDEDETPELSQTLTMDEVRCFSRVYRFAQPCLPLGFELSEIALVSECGTAAAAFPERQAGAAAKVGVRQGAESGGHSPSHPCRTITSRAAAWRGRGVGGPWGGTLNEVGSWYA